MKKILLTGFYAMLLALPVQLFAVGPIDIDAGIKLGANFNKINGKYWDNGYKANMTFGLFGGLGFGKVGVQAEALFAQSSYVTGTGFRNMYEDAINPSNYSDSSGKINVSRIQIPVLINYRIFKILKLQAGPQFSGVIHVKDKNAFLKDAKSMFKSGWDGVVGLQANFPFGIHASARYIFGLSDFNNSSARHPITGAALSDAWRNSTFQITVGYSFL